MATTYQTAKPQETHAQDVQNITAQHNAQLTTQVFIVALTAQTTKPQDTGRQTENAWSSKRNAKKSKTAYPKTSTNSSQHQPPKHGSF